MIALFLLGVAITYYILRSTKKDLSPEELQLHLKDRVVIVTGAARGLGKQVAKSFYDNGANVVLVDCRTETLKETVSVISNNNSDDQSRVLALVGDLSDKQFCHVFLTMTDCSPYFVAREVVNQAMTKFGKLDVLYINHGIMPACSVSDNSIEMIERVISVNFMSFVYLAKLALPHIRASKGMIGLTSSMAGKTAMMNLAHYCSSKHALLGFFDALRIEEQPQGVSVTVVCPGGMKTDLLREGFGEAPKESAFYKLQLPEDIAPSIVRAVVQRKRELYTETALRVMSIIRALFPGAVDKVLGPLTVKHV